MRPRKTIDDPVIADAEEDLVGSLPMECRMGHHFIVGFDVERDETTKSSKAIQRVKVEPSVLPGADSGHSGARPLQ